MMEKEEPMELPAPTALSEVLIDGAIAQAASTFALQQTCGPIKDIAFNPVPGGYQVQIRSGSQLHTFFGVTSAHIRGQEWVWRQEFAFDIPELKGTQEGSDALVSAARTLNGNGPSYFVPLNDGSFDLIVLQEPLPQLPLRDALTVGLASTPTLKDIERALMAFAAERNLQFERDADVVTLKEASQSVAVDLRAGGIVGGMQLFDVLSDAFFSSCEHQLFYEGLGNPEVISFDPKTNTTPFGPAVHIASIRDGRFRFQWQEQNQHPAVHAAHKFIMDHGIAALLRPEWSVEEAQQLRLESAVKPILHQWTHAFCQLDQHTIGVLLFGGDSVLPPLTKAAAMATLNTATPEHVNARRSLDFYARQRNARLIATDQHTAELECSDGRLIISFEGSRIIGVHDAYRMGA